MKVAVFIYLCHRPTIAERPCNFKPPDAVSSHCSEALHPLAASYEETAQRLLPERSWRRVVLSGGLAHQSRLLRDMIASRLAALVPGTPAVLYSAQQKGRAGLWPRPLNEGDPRR